MPDDALITAIEQDANEQCQRLLNEAQEAAAEMVAAAEQKAAQDSKARAAGLDAELERKSASALNAARTKAAGRLLSVRIDIAGEVLRRVEGRFAALKRQEYVELLKRFYSELKDDWFEAHEPSVHLVLVNPADTGVIEDPEAEFKADESVSLGVVFASKDGQLRYENTVASRIWKARETLLPIIDGILTGKG